MKSDSKNYGGVRMTRWMLAAALVVLAAFAAACGTDETNSANGGANAQVVPKGPAKGSFTFSQWPLYIDPGKNGTVAQFEKEKGIRLKYVEEINDNDQFFGKIRPQLERGDSGGRSLITLSDW